MKLEGKSLKSDFLRFITRQLSPSGYSRFISMVDGILCGKRGYGSGTDSGEYLHAVYNRTVFCLHPVCSREFDDCGNLSRTGGKTEGERSLYAECGLIMYPVGVDYNTGYDISGSICKIPWSNGSYSSICENIYWNDRTIFCSIYPILFI